MPKKPSYPLPRSECLCSICREILLEPVTLPCDHTLCRPCFQMTVEKASLCCPFCRKRVSSWARHHARSETLVNKELWEVIQRQYPEECHRRACGLDTEEDEFEDGFTPYPAPQLCNPGEIRKEYEDEISKAEAERLRIEEEERRASEEYIRKLLAEEEAEQQLSLERANKELEEQMKKDEELAWMLNSDLNESTASSARVSIVESPVIHKKTKNTKSSKNVKRDRTQSGDIERFLSPKSVKDFVTKGLSHVRNGDLKNISTDAVSISSSLQESEDDDDDDDAMPTLSPQSLFSVHSSPLEASDSELQLPGLTKYSPSRHALQGEGSFANKASGQTATNEALIAMNIAAFSPPRSSSSLDTSLCINMTRMSEQGQIPKRALNFFEDTENQPNRKRPCLENSTSPRRHTERLMELEETLHERKLQEEQDRLLALKLQRLLDKELAQVSRQKGSPDEYKLRPKTSAPQQNSLESEEPLKRTASKHNSEQRSSNSSGSGESSDENKKPASKKQDPLERERRRKPTGQPLTTNGEKILKPSNKQQTIMDMFKRSSSK